MATYSATDYLTKGVAGHGLGGNVKALNYVISATAALTTADILNFGYAPAGFRCLWAFLEADDLDTNGTPTLTLNVGDASDADRLFAASIVGQAGTASSAPAVTGVNYLYTAKTLITGAPAANAATGAAGTITLTLVGVLEDSATS